jgi:predicted RNase H-like HicB family nuclease
MGKNLDYYMNLSYNIEVRFLSEEDGGGVAVCHPELGRLSCHAWGETFDEAMGVLVEIKKGIFQRCLEKSLPIPEPAPDEEDMDYSGKLLLRLPKVMHRAVANMAKESGTSINSAIVLLLTEAMTRRNAMEDTKKALAEFFNGVEWPVQHHIHHQEGKEAEKACSPGTESFEKAFEDDMFTRTA